ncbi:hypothetical protein Sta7437_0841 [Stanieria cyanosphaera PCC 7437]|uniref:Fluorescence recovery protein n=1 Tax=Stanieria cyanosphaera (strain ATCC 29371 / PCC 7437) TaxID=111780 RepID=K9XQR4_STAC7|nr:hypothetical protein [Stanieria cyanosphaera]AFZ34429.1 hypothetical protein Sta7437_0841 [Stanieria cyanosphaera PCC 7437]
MSEIKWSETEEKIAKQAFEKAYQRETLALIKIVREQASQITKLEDLWYLHDLLSTKRHEIDGKYDYDHSTLVFVFAQLLKQGWLHHEELKGLNPKTLSKISALARI